MKLIKIWMLTCLTFLSFYSAANIQKVEQFGPNPGNLSLYTYVPKNLTDKAPMVVVMHGCLQDAAMFVEATGWAEYALRLGLILVLPEQNKSNNAMSCFTWYEKEDVMRDKGEVASIASMMTYVEKNYSIDSQKVFVTGLSAGATMSAALMASYPERIKGGAIVAGVSYGCAFKVHQSFTCMFAPSDISAQTRGDYIREASGNYIGRYPNAFVIHGSNDTFVKTTNAQHSIAQWANIHNVDSILESTVAMNPKDQTFEALIANTEQPVKKLIVSGAAHGWPIDHASGCGQKDKYVIETGICAVDLITKAWGLNK